MSKLSTYNIKILKIFNTVITINAVQSYQIRIVSVRGAYLGLPCYKAGCMKATSSNFSESRPTDDSTDVITLMFKTIIYVTLKGAFVLTFRSITVIFFRPAHLLVEYCFHRSLL